MTAPLEGLQKHWWVLHAFPSAWEEFTPLLLEKEAGGERAPKTTSHTIPPHLPPEGVVLGWTTKVIFFLENRNIRTWMIQPLIFDSNFKPFY